MTRSYDRYKDIPLGLIIKKDLRTRHLSQKSLAQAIGMSYCKLNRIINGHSYFNKKQASSIDNFFGYEESFIYRLQINSKGRSQTNQKAPGKKNLTDQKSTNSTVLNDPENITYPDYQIPFIRSCVFWDTDIRSLDWIRYQDFIERRIALHGNREENLIIASFYKSLNK